MDTQFLETVFADSIQHPNFFNGRILTATDLRDEQAANLKRSRYLGQAIGSGVVRGLDVTVGGDGRALTITGGLALNRRGDVLRLPGDSTTVELVFSRQATAPTPSPFIPCNIAGATTLTGVLSQGGYYLLAITNATRVSSTMAANSGLNGDRPNCTNRYEEIGVQFKLVPLTQQDFVTPIAPTALDSRSRLAHLCLGTHQLATLANNPLLPSDRYGLVDALYTSQRLTLCDVPLAVFLFQAARVQFVDGWAVRRPCQVVTQRDVSTVGTPASQVPFPEYVFNTVVSPRRTVESAAFLMQFQTHLHDLAEQIRQDAITASPPAAIAAKYFEFLPAAGYLPLPVGLGTDANNLVNFARRFFGSSLAIIPALNSLPAIDMEALRQRFYASFYEPPIRINQDRVEVYRVSGQPYLVFFRDRHLSDRAIAQLVPGSGVQGTRVTAMIWGRDLAQVTRLQFPTLSGSGDQAIAVQILPGATDGWVPVNFVIGSRVPPGRYPFQLETTTATLNSSLFGIVFEVLPSAPIPPGTTPPVTTVTIPPVTTFTIPPASTFTIPPASTFTIPPASTFTIPPASTFTIPPVSSFTPPIGTLTVPPFTQFPLGGGGLLVDEPIRVDRNLNELSGLNVENLNQLEREGIRDLTDLAALEPRTLAPILGISEVRAMGFIDQARRQLTQ